MTTEELFKLREQQILAVRRVDEDDYDNPIIHAESGPNRYQSITWYFPDPECDGVRVEEDLDLHTKRVFYFGVDGEETELTEGVMHDWAIDLFDRD